MSILSTADCVPVEGVQTAAVISTSRAERKDSLFLLRSNSCVRRVADRGRNSPSFFEISVAEAANLLNRRHFLCGILPPFSSLLLVQSCSLRPQFALMLRRRSRVLSIRTHTEKNTRRQSLLII